MGLKQSLSGLLGKHPHGRDQKRVRKQDLQWRPLDWAGTVKIQRSLNEPVDAFMAVFSQDGQIHYIAPMIPEVLDMLGEKLKVYAYAELRAGIVDVQRKVEDQDW
jgi:hypothetical protein